MHNAAWPAATLIVAAALVVSTAGTPDVLSVLREAQDAACDPGSLCAACPVCTCANASGSLVALLRESATSNGGVPLSYFPTVPDAPAVCVNDAVRFGIDTAALGYSMLATALHPSYTSVSTWAMGPITSSPGGLRMRANGPGWFYGNATVNEDTHGFFFSLTAMQASNTDPRTQQPVNFTQGAPTLHASAAVALGALHFDAASCRAMAAGSASLQLMHGLATTLFVTTPNAASMPNIREAPGRVPNSAAPAARVASLALLRVAADAANRPGGDNSVAWLRGAVETVLGAEPCAHAGAHGYFPEWSDAAGTAPFDAYTNVVVFGTFGVGSLCQNALTGLRVLEIVLQRAGVNRTNASDPWTSRGVQLAAGASADAFVSTLLRMALLRAADAPFVNGTEEARLRSLAAGLDATLHGATCQADALGGLPGVVEPGFPSTCTSLLPTARATALVAAVEQNLNWFAPSPCVVPTPSPGSAAAKRDTHITVIVIACAVAAVVVIIVGIVGYRIHVRRRMRRHSRLMPMPPQSGDVGFF